jgi:flavin reductase (DIM6/NTAB) family NADH-FMN oxidoreductase RutF
MGKLIWKPGTLLYPLPAVMVSLGTVEAPQVLTVAWTGIVCSVPVMTYISVRPERHSYATLKEAGEFVINLTTEDLARATDYCGVRSGRDTDKWQDMGLTPLPASQVSAPLIAQSPINLECRVRQVLPLGSHDLFLAEVVAVEVEESAVVEGRLRLDKCHLIAYSHGHYVTLGHSLGSFGYSVRKKPAGKARKAPRRR